jgi:mannose/cellobiose epimerase-like protein (N-acyl-D-glucosamine 2-epimerase family)
MHGVTLYFLIDKNRKPVVKPKSVERGARVVTGLASLLNEGKTKKHAWKNITCKVREAHFVRLGKNH